MNLSSSSSSSSIIKTTPFSIKPTLSFSNHTRISEFSPYHHGVRYPLPIIKCSTRANLPLPIEANKSPPPPPPPPSTINKLESFEEGIEKIIYRCRFLAVVGVFGSLFGSILCFVKGCTNVYASFMEYFLNRAKVIIFLVEAIDVYLLGTVMLVFGMGLYELFVSNLDSEALWMGGGLHQRSNLFGLFTLKERPRWLEIKTVNELKTKLGHVIVMLLLIGFFEKSKTAAIQTPTDLLCFSASVLLCSGCLYLLARLNNDSQ